MTTNKIIILLQMLTVLGQREQSSSSNTNTRVSTSRTTTTSTEPWYYVESSSTTQRPLYTTRRSTTPPYLVREPDYDLPSRQVISSSTRKPVRQSGDSHRNPSNINNNFHNTRRPVDEYPPWTRQTTTERTTTTTQAYPIDTNIEPTIDFSVTDTSIDKTFNKTWTYTIWNANKTKTGILAETSMKIQLLGDFKIKISCDASYPIKLVSSSSFEKSELEFDEYRLSNEKRAGPIFRVVLTLKYKMLEHMERKQMFLCKSFENDRNEARETYLDLIFNPDSKVLNAHVKKRIGRATTTTSTGSWISNREQDAFPEYSEQFGANIRCNLDLEYVKQLDTFVCTKFGSDDYTRKHNVTIRFKECDDDASCSRITQQRRCDFNFQNYNDVVKHDIAWGTNPPPSGIVYCKWDEGGNNESAAVTFYHSLPKLCPQDLESDNSSRTQQIHFNTARRPDIKDLERKFVSFCPASDVISDPNIKSNSTKNLTVTIYEGETLTVSCLSSIYFFAEATKIKMNTAYGKEYPNISDVKMSKEKKGSPRGFYNFTATVIIKSKDVREIICENFLKQSKDSVEKVLRVNVKTPKNISIDELGTPFIQIYDGNTFNLECMVRGDPPPQISWKKEGSFITSTNMPLLKIATEEISGGKKSYLIFPSTSNGEEINSLHGAYSCKAVNTIQKEGLERTYTVQKDSSNLNPTVLDNDGNKIDLTTDSGNSWLVWAIVVPVLLLVAGAIIAFLVWKIRKQGKQLSALSKAEVDEFIFGKPEFLQHHSSTEEVNNYAPYLPYNKSYEIGREQLEIDDNGIIGSGAYAVVLKGTLNTKSGDKLSVAIKTAKPMDDMGFFKALLSELKIMGFIGTHPNIVNLVGAYTKNIMNREVFIAIEFCDNGNLLTFLRDNRHRIVNLVGPNGDMREEVSVHGEHFLNPNKDGLSTVTLIKWAMEIANGMEFLSRKKVIHGDIAARNILLDANLKAKISDFGLSRQLFEYANYIKKQQSPLPWKWLAIECLQDMRFSMKSDVWAYGILNYEIFSLGQVPYPGYAYNDEFLDALLQGKRPNRPAYASTKIYENMECCWKERSEDRPNFTTIKEFFLNLLESLVPEEQLDEYKETELTLTSPIFLQKPGLQGHTLSEKEYSSDGSWSRQEGRRKGFEPRASFNAKTLTAAFRRN